MRYFPFRIDKYNKMFSIIYDIQICHAFARYMSYPVSMYFCFGSVELYISLSL